MKNNYTLFATFILCFFIFTNGLFSQYSPIKAKAGIPTALDSVKKYIKDPELFFLGTETGNFKAGSFTIPNTFDITKGTAVVWVYMYRSISKPDSVKFFGVVFALGTYIGGSVDPSMLNGKLPFTPVDAIANQTWIDSDVMSLDITNNNDYKAYLLKYSDTKLQLAGLAVDPNLKGIYWVVKFSSKDGYLNCSTNVATGETVCMSETPVIDPLTSEFMIYPNPVSSMAVISIPTVHNNYRIELYNTLGEKLISVNAEENSNSSRMILDLSGFTDGVYFLNYISNGINLVKPIIIKK